MLTLAAVREVRAPASLVWQVATDFPSYPKWTGAARIERGTSGSDDLAYTIRVTTSGGGVRNWTFPGRVRADEPPRRIVWGLGVLGILGMQISFDLRPQTGSTEVSHVARFTGLVAMIRPGLIRRIIQPVLDQTLQDLEAEVRRRSRPPTGRAGVGASRGRSAKPRRS